MRVKIDQAKGSPEPIQALNRVILKENNEPLVSLYEWSSSAKILRPSVIPYLRQKAAEMLEEAARELPKGIYLEVLDAWRPIEFQEKMYQTLMDFAKEAFPNASYAVLRRKVNKWVAPYDQKAPPGHSTGAAVDVRLIDQYNAPLDVISPLSIGHNSCPTYVLGLSEQAYKNRMLLVETMLYVGFSNCKDEWWHYSYGDAGWAVRLGYPSCIYGQMVLPKEKYQKQLDLKEKYEWAKSNPFLK